MNSQSNTDTVAPTVTTTTTPVVASIGTPSVPQSNIIRLRPPPTGIPLPNIVSGAEFVANSNLVVPGELIRGLLHRQSKGVLGGSSKAGKSWILLDMALSVNSGTQFLGFNTVAGRVLFINLEIQAEFFQRRVQAVQQRKGITTIENLQIWNLRGVSVSIDRLIGDLQRQQGTPYSLIIIDPIYKLMTGRSENLGSNITTLVQNIDRLVAQTKSAVVYTNHFSKGAQSKKRAIDRLGGSGVYARDADTIITLTDHRQLACFTVEATERNLPPIESFVVEWQHPLMALRPHINANDLRTREDSGPLAEEVNYVTGLLADGPLTAEAWQTAAIEGGLSAANFLRIRQRLEATGQVRLDGENGWRLDQDEPPAAAAAPATAPATAEASNRPVIRDAWRDGPPRRARPQRTTTTPENTPAPQIRPAVQAPMPPVLGEL